MLLLSSAAIASCGASHGPTQIARGSNLETFSSATGTVSTRWSDGTADVAAIEPSTDAGVRPGTCSVSLRGDVYGRIGQPDLFAANPSVVLVECERTSGARWYLIGTTDNLAMSKAGDNLVLRTAKAGGPTSACFDTTMSVTVSISVTDAVGVVDPSAIDVTSDFLRRTHVAGRVGSTMCGVTEMTLDIVAEIRSDAFHFSQWQFSGTE